GPPATAVRTSGLRPRHLRPDRDRHRSTDQRSPRAVPQPHAHRYQRHPGKPVDGRPPRPVAPAGSGPRDLVAQAAAMGNALVRGRGWCRRARSGRPRRDWLCVGARCDRSRASDGLDRPPADRLRPPTAASLCDRSFICRRDGRIRGGLGQRFARSRDRDLASRGVASGELMGGLVLYGINYAPETTGIAPYTTALAEHWAESHRVSVVTGFPHYPAWRTSANDRRMWAHETR